MPHFVIEYSSDVESNYDIAKLVNIAFETGAASDVMHEKDLKVRARPYDYHRMIGMDDGFVHVTVFLLAGRSDDQKLSVSQALVENLGNYLTGVTSVSVDVRDMNPSAYKKRLLQDDEG